ncbi:MAG TPA: PepSY domain-containing protein [Candidatus Nesterenkonia stercoripullorum]|uniref:PepSY domain-containing protein n=1 Tax=Candidatus Nesterenkonia stercoripullorum TaxID=2838701 RepID=A0A9D1UUC5_9MICC|nr:PepSY domain-containing protein [Candidatus Nesterenkonia stercoripullorum]
MAKITELKTLSVAASAAAILSLSACGSQGGGESEPEENGNSAETQEATEDSTDESTEEATDEATEDTTEDPAEDSTDDPTEGESNGESAAEGQTGGDDGGPIEDAKAAIATAEGEVDGTAYEVDFEEADDDDDDDDDDEQEPHWSVGVISGDREWEVRVSADGADVLGTEEDDADSDDVSELDAATVTLEEAIDAAAEDTSGDLDDASLDDDNGTLYWEVSIYPEGEQRSQDIDVDAESGGIINR